jgi:hypothetical protein
MSHLLQIQPQSWQAQKSQARFVKIPAVLNEVPRLESAVETNTRMITIDPPKSVGGTGLDQSLGDMVASDATELIALGDSGVNTYIQCRGCDFGYSLGFQLS